MPMLEVQDLKVRYGPLEAVRGISFNVEQGQIVALVMELCHRIVVLVQGEKVAEGTPQAIRDNPAVIEAYLGAPDYAHA